MADPMKIPPETKAKLSTGLQLANRLEGLLGKPFNLKGKSRSDGSNIRKLVAATLQKFDLPSPAPEEAWECIIPKRKGVPRLLREFIDTYIVTSGSSYNLQVWNRNPTEPIPQIEYQDGAYLRANDVRFVFARVDPSRSVIRTVIVATPSYIVEHFGKFGKPTVKQQLIISQKAREKLLASSSPILFYSDDQSVNTCPALGSLSSTSMHDSPSVEGVLPLDVIRQLVAPKLIGQRIAPGATKNRGQTLERMVAELLGYRPSAEDLLAGGFPDLRHQALEVKVQDAATVDLGRYTPQFEETVPNCEGFTTRNMRYLIALMDAKSNLCKGLIICPGSRLGEHFTYVGDKSFKCQRSIPMAFFDKFDGQSVFNPDYT